jgi:hypothetical protein
MRILRFAAFALVLVGFTACKKGGGYLRTAPVPVAVP